MGIVTKTTKHRDILHIYYIPQVPNRSKGRRFTMLLSSDRTTIMSFNTSLPHLIFHPDLQKSTYRASDQYGRECDLKCLYLSALAFVDRRAKHRLALSSYLL